MKLHSQFLDNAKECLLYCAHRRSEVVCNLFAGETFLMLHDEHQPLTRRGFFETLKNLLNHDVVEGCTIRSCDREPCSFGDVSGSWQFLPPLVTEKRVHHDSAQPRVKRRVASEPIDRTIGIQKNFLRQILGIVMIAAKPHRQGVHRSAMRRHEYAKGIDVPSFGPGNKICFSEYSHSRFSCNRHVTAGMVGVGSRIERCRSYGSMTSSSESIVSDAWPFFNVHWYLSNSREENCPPESGGQKDREAGSEIQRRRVVPKPKRLVVGTTPRVIALAAR